MSTNALQQRRPALRTAGGVVSGRGSPCGPRGEGRRGPHPLRRWKLKGAAASRSQLRNCPSALTRPHRRPLRPSASVRSGDPTQQLSSNCWPATHPSKGPPVLLFVIRIEADEPFAPSCSRPRTSADGSLADRAASAIYMGKFNNLLLKRVYGAPSSERSTR